MHSPLVLAIDIGSSSVRAALYDRHARVVPGTESRSQHLLHADGAGAATEDPAHLLDRVEEAIDEVLRRAGARAQQIQVLAMDTLASTVLGVDADNRPLTPIYTYADTAARAEVGALRTELDTDALHQRTGCPLHTAYLPARLRWLHRTQPHVFEEVCQWLDIGTFLYRRWFGCDDVPCSYSIASWSGFLDRFRNTWDTELLGYLGVSPDRLPPLADYRRAQRGLAAPFARRWPALADAPFLLAVGDGAAANVGSGCVGPDRMALTVGTSGALRLLLSEATPLVLPGLWAYRLGLDRTLLGGSFSNGGNVFAWAREALRLPPGDDLERQLQALEPDSHGLTVLPFLAGERSPGWANNATGSVYGLTMATTPVQVLQALLEAVSYRFAAVAALLESYAGASCQVIASGGAVTGSPYWLQLMADALGHPVAALAVPEATLRGTAVLALHGLGITQSLDAADLPPSDLGQTLYPNPTRVVVYRKARERQDHLYDALIRRPNAGDDANITEGAAR